jgi:hypothetical protein
MSAVQWEFTNSESYESARHRIRHEGNEMWVSYRKTPKDPLGLVLGIDRNYGAARLRCEMDLDMLIAAETKHRAGA